MHLYDSLKAEQVRLSSLICDLERRVKKLPEGDLCFWKNGSKYKYFAVIDGKRHYISLKEQDRIRELAQKKYLETMLVDAQKEKQAIDKYLKMHVEEKQADVLIMTKPHLVDLLQPMFQIRDERLEKWAKAEYPSSAGHPEHLIHEGPEGRMYRSKSEAWIANALYTNRIPFRYEWDKIINGRVYPIDFTIRHPVTGETYYWEHLGLMDDLGYARRNAQKLVDYESAGIFPGVNLILTYESGQFPLSIGQIEKIVREWFL